MFIHQFGWIVRNADAQVDIQVKLLYYACANPFRGREQGGGEGLASR